MIPGKIIAKVKYSQRSDVKRHITKITGAVMIRNLLKKN